MPRSLAILGGSFNPPHIGHVRMAYEVLEQLSPDSILFVPSACPPHKQQQLLLPFEFRYHLLESCIATIPRFSISAMEAERPGPSYTVDTLRELRQLYPERELVFIMGAEDLPTLPLWRDWEELLGLADLAVLPRTGAFGPRSFHETMAALHKKMGHTAASGSLCRPEHAPLGGLAYTLNGQRLIYYLEQPVLEISSTLIRERWRKNLSLDLFLPDKVLTLLKANTQFVQDCWATI